MTQQAQAPDAAPIITIEQAGHYAAHTVTIRGWLYNMRESGKLLFPIFRDGTGIIQGVVSLKEQPQAFEALKGIPQESSVIVTGKIQAEPRAQAGTERRSHPHHHHRHRGEKRRIYQRDVEVVHHLG